MNQIFLANTFPPKAITGTVSLDDFMRFYEKHWSQSWPLYLVVITGITHAWKRGIPDQLRQFPGESNYRVLLPEIPGSIEPGSITSEDADYIFLK